MQTFLPYPDYYSCAKVLDKKRAWKQVVEAYQILKVLEFRREGLITKQRGKKIGWLNHPAVLMWVGYEASLVSYYNIFWDYCVEVHKVKAVKLQKKKDFSGSKSDPIWLGYEPLHSSHRGRLLDKNPEHYRKFGWIDQPRSEKLGYIWPVDKNGFLIPEIKVLLK